MSQYGESLRFYLADVKDLESEIEQSTFDKAELEKLADLIIATGCLLKPLILKQINPFKYKVLEGHFEYHAAVLANQKDSQRVLGGMVSAFVVKPEIETTVLEQIRALKGTISVIGEIPTTPIVTEPNELENRVIRLERELVRLQSLENRMNQLEEMLKQSQTVNVPIPPIPTEKPKEVIKPVVSTHSSNDTDAKILAALNTWNAVMLVAELKGAGITPKIAGKVIEARSKQPFTNLKDIKDRKIGIGEKIMKNIISKFPNK